MAGNAGFSAYRSPNIPFCVAVGVLSGIAGIWTPLIAANLGRPDLSLINLPWGVAYNLASGLIVTTLGSKPATLGAALIVLVGMLLWPLMVGLAVSYGAYRYSLLSSIRLKRTVAGLFALSLLIDSPATSFVPDGPNCAFFIFIGFLD